uniref:Uncharacterized protein n=1 Tax=Haemonchus placei TaxID=6290 RepID=A0A0N4WDL2_HAEPC
MGMEVDVLTGMNYYWDVVDFSSSRQLPSELAESRTKLGSVFSGYLYSSTQSTAETTSVEGHREPVTETDRIIQHLPGLESLETKDEADETNASLIQHYYNTTNHPLLADNKALAIRRLENQYKKLRRNKKVWEEYCKAFDQQHKSGIIEERVVSPWKIGALHSTSSGIQRKQCCPKLRIVFDASSHMRDVSNLNECVHQGRTLLTHSMARYHEHG